jgi:hypothetical protein
MKGYIIMNPKKFESLGIAEIHSWIYARDIYRPNRNKTEPEAEACMRAHLEAGLKQVAFSVGRSTVLYHSKDPRITRHMEIADFSNARSEDVEIYKELEKDCFFTTAINYAHKNDMIIYAHLCMNRHYSKDALGGTLTSKLARQEELQEINKDGSRDTTRLCYAFDDFREERLAIIRETALLGADGICLDFVRQPPMLRYHPALTEPYKEKTGKNPKDINVEMEPDSFLDWCKYRADVLTDFMRSVKKLLLELELQTGRRIPLLARITDDGLTANMIAGIDIETWCREKIIDILVTHPLQWIHGFWIHDVSPYVDIGRLTGVKVFGGVNTYPVHKGFQFNPVCIALRIKEQYDAGVAGISMYETNDTVLHSDLTPILKSIHCYDDIASLLADKKWRDRWPVNGLNANCGMDNHSGSVREVLLGL